MFVQILNILLLYRKVSQEKGAFIRYLRIFLDTFCIFYYIVYYMA